MQLNKPFGVCFAFAQKLPSITTAVGRLLLLSYVQDELDPPVDLQGREFVHSKSSYRASNASLGEERKEMVSADITTLRSDDETTTRAFSAFVSSGI